LEDDMTDEKDLGRLITADKRTVTDRSLARVGDRKRYTARCGGYFGGGPGYIVFQDVRDADGALVGAEINGDAPLFDDGWPCAGDLVSFVARLVDWRNYEDDCMPFTFEDMGEAEIVRRAMAT
jgi:hypothetical protein